VAQKKVWVGSVGPYLFEDTEVYADPDIPGVVMHGLVTTSQIHVTEAATDPEHLVRVDDFLGLMPQALDTTDSPTFASLTLTVDLAVGGDAVVTGGLTVGTDADVAGDLTVDGTADVTGDLTAGGDLGVTGNAVIGGALDHNGATVGFFGVTPAARPAAYTPTNVTTDRSYDADTVAIAELADIVGTLIADLQSLGLLG
jgi:hypothetical protein